MILLLLFHWEPWHCVDIKVSLTSSKKDQIYLDFWDAEIEDPVSSIVVRATFTAFLQRSTQHLLESICSRRDTLSETAEDASALGRCFHLFELVRILPEMSTVQQLSFILKNVSVFSFFSLRCLRWLICLTLPLTRKGKLLKT